jgi:carboxypeptidase family protein
VMLEWLRIVQTDPTSVSTQPRSLVTRTDSTGTYYACGVASDMKVVVRGYARADSTGLVDVQLGPRAVGRQDLLVARSPTRKRAVLRGTVTTSEQSPVYGGRVTVRESGSTVINSDGGFVLRDLPLGTQWVTVQAIGRAPFGQAVDLREGDTTWLSVTLSPLPVTLAPVRVTTQPSRLLAEFEERRRAGLGYSLGEADLASIPSMRAALTTLPAVRFARGAGLTDFVVLLPNPGISGRGYCIATLYIDGAISGYEQLHSYRPSDLVGIELYPRASSAPLQYQSVATGCGVLLIWTKYLK